MVVLLLFLLLLPGLDAWMESPTMLQLGSRYWVTVKVAKSDVLIY